MMLKKLLVLTLILGSANVLFSQSQDFFFWYWDLGTSTVTYGDDAVNKANDVVYAEDVGKLIVTGDIGVGIDLDDRIRLLTGAVVLTDVTLNTEVFANRLDYGFFTGFKIYPNLAGLNFGVDYVLGNRVDFIKFPGENAMTMSTTAWGNGFRVNMGYDFSYHGLRFAPNVEGSYRMMPRGGGNVDQYFSVFLNFNIFP